MTNPVGNELISAIGSAAYGTAATSEYFTTQQVSNLAFSGNATGTLPVTNGGTGTTVGGGFANVQNLVPSVVFSKWRVARANVQNGTSNARILFPGDSTVAGYGDSTAATIAATRSMPTRLASLLNTTVTPAAVGLGIPPSTLNLTTDNRWTVGSGWTNAALGAGASAAGAGH